MSNKQIYVPITAGAQQYKQEWDEAIKTTNSAKDAIVNAAVGASQAAQKQAGAVNTLTKEYRASFAEAQKLTQMGASHQSAYIQAAKAAGQYKNDLDDTREVIKAFSSDTPVLTASLGVMQGLAGAASAVAGAYGLMGVEGEEVQKVMLKVQSAMALVQGLQAVGAMADSFKALKVVLVAEVVPALMTVSGALIATGIGALVVAVGVLAMYWSNVADEADKATKAQEAAADTAKRVAALDKKSLDDRMALRELQVRAMKDGKAKEIAQIDLARDKELQAARDVYNESSKSYFFKARLQEKETAITEYYARQRADIEKKYKQPSRVISAITIDTRMTGKAGADMEHRKLTIKSLQSFKQDVTKIAMDFKAIPIADWISYPLTETQIKLKEFSEYVNNVGKNLIAPALTNMAAAIGNAIASGANPIKAAGNALLAALGNFMVQLGSQMIIIGTLGAAFEKSIASLQWYVAIPLGIALVAAGAALSGIAAAGPSGGGGAGSGGGGNMGAGFFGASLQPAVNQQPNLGSKIRGRDLFIVQGRNNRAANRFGGM